MKVTQTAIADVLVLEPKVFGDARGFFTESFNQQAFDAATGTRYEFVQDNHSRSCQGVLRGLHYQLPPTPRANWCGSCKGLCGMSPSIFAPTPPPLASGWPRHSPPKTTNSCGCLPVLPMALSCSATRRIFSIKPQPITHPNAIEASPGMTQI